MESLENELCPFSKLSTRFTYITAQSPTLPSLYLCPAHSPTLPLLHLRHSSFSNPSFALRTSQLILQSFRFHLRHSSFSNPSVALRTSQPILQSFSCFTYVTAHSATLLSLYLRHSSFSNPSDALPTSQFILQPFFRFSYVTEFSLTSPGEPPMPSVASPTS